MQDVERAYTRTANGLSHHIVEWGPADSERCIVMCHGFLDQGAGFMALAPELAREGYRVVAPDLRGHGQTDWVPKGGYYYFPDYVLDLHALLPEVVGSPFHLVGHSMGGTVAALYAALHAPQLLSLCLIEGFGPPDEPAQAAPQRMRRWLDGVDAVRGKGAPARFANLTEAVARLRARHPTVAGALLEKLAIHSTRPSGDAEGVTWRFDPLHRTRSPIGFDAARFAYFLAAIETRTLLVLGERGLRLGDEAQRLSRIRNSTQAVLQGAGHMMHWTHAPELAALLLSHFALSTTDLHAT